jgi:hypothetical protein
MKPPTNRFDATGTLSAAPLIDPEGLVGFDLRNAEQDLGELEEVVDLRGRAYYVIDSRHWTFGTKRLLPVSAVDKIELDERAVSTNTEIEAIRAAPDFDPFHLDDEGYIAALEEHYGLDPIEAPVEGR